MTDKKIKLIVTDLDGTLLDDNKQIPDGFLDIIDEIARHDILFFTASGRNFSSQHKLFGRKADDINYLCDNGAYIFENSEIIYLSLMEPDAWHRALEFIFAECPNAHPILCGLRGTYTTEYHGDIGLTKELEKVYTGSTIVDDVRKVKDDIYKISLCMDHGAHDIMAPALSSYSRDGIVILETDPSFMDVLNSGNTKGTAVSFIQKRHSIAPEETMIFVDYYNDLSMIDPRSATYAMANAPDDIKSKCRFIAPANNEGGVLTVIKEYLSSLE